MSEFTIRFPNEQKKRFVQPISAGALLAYMPNIDKTVYGMKVNNELVALSKTIDIRASVEPVLKGTQEGSKIYRRTLCLLLAAASQALYPEPRLLVGHSLGYSYYYTLEGNNTEKIDFKKIEEKMRELVEADIPIQTRWLSYEEAIEMFQNSNQPDTYKLLSYISKPKILINKLGDFHDLFFQPVMDRTGEVKVFELMPYGEGFLLRFPSTAEPDKLPVFDDIPQLFTVYKEYKQWGKLVGVSAVGQLNTIIEKRKTKDYVEIIETMQNNKLAKIAGQIEEKKTVKLVLIAGPSSSGKTTTAKKLSMQLRVLGFDPHIISLDDFYLGSAKTPIGEDGKPDYECLEAIDVPLINEILLKLFNGEMVELPSYNFKTGEREYRGKTLQCNERSIVIMEGIHGLNDKTTAEIDPNLKFKIYLSALTQLNLDDHNRIPTSDNRLLRRIVRDAQFRSTAASKTIEMWENVRSGEAKYIFPYQGNADAMFNTALDYELSVLKIYAEPLLRTVKPTDPSYSEASRLLMFLNNFLSISPSFVPGQSILREFIGDSDFSYR
ncbi:nucleoside kinase [Treponema phagedenis]|uniref:Nucleoside kinase n=1 Tax=Treponema phagedenis TaxID=162 RepID=A0AAE6ITP5_TREPH|nr:nucleoside kinase [Treponema phagedenis]NVP23129.1 nucleoside kinase [Treponema phagedenis]QEJ95394.1 nucleoside kinase [Treponema phagedenis]QEJ98064.1 nucleoside kinase [Treponema phagedenis]QEK01247.1 nucleoside kinase [Treponema phagedenis]QEK03569.1 nucleoside kinase [Treponema phagedenis]